MFKSTRYGGSGGLLDLAAWVERQLAAVEQCFFNLDTPNLVELHREPVKPRVGMTVLADGTDWDPGSGQGVYTYYAGAWHKLG